MARQNSGHQLPLVAQVAITTPSDKLVNLAQRVRDITSAISGQYDQEEGPNLTVVQALYRERDRVASIMATEAIRRHLAP